MVALVIDTQGKSQTANRGWGEPCAEYGGIRLNAGISRGPSAVFEFQSGRKIHPQVRRRRRPRRGRSSATVQPGERLGLEARLIPWSLFARW